MYVCKVGILYSEGYSMDMCSGLVSYSYWLNCYCLNVPYLV